MALWSGPVTSRRLEELTDPGADQVRADLADTDSALQALTAGL